MTLSTSDAVRKATEEAVEARMGTRRGMDGADRMMEVNSLVLPSRDVPPGGEFAMECLEALPRHQTWLCSVRRYVGEEHVHYSTDADGNPVYEPVVPPQQLIYPWSRDDPPFGIPDAALSEVRELLTRDPAPTDYFEIDAYYLGCASTAVPGSPAWQIPAIRIYWPYHHCDAAREEPWRRALQVTWGHRRQYRGQDESSPAFGYLPAFMRRLSSTVHVEHALGFVDQYLPVQPLCFAVWHRNLRDFAVDMLWTLLMVLDEDACWLDPVTRLARNLVGELVSQVRAAARPTPDLRRWRDSLRWVDRDSRPPRLTEAHLRRLLCELEGVAHGIRALSREDILDAAAACTGCSFVETGPGGCVWAKSGIYGYVDEFYLHLVRRACPGLIAL